MKKEKNQRGVSLVLLVVIVAVVAIVSLIIFFMTNNSKESEKVGNNIQPANSNIESSTVSAIPEKVLYKPNSDKQIYFNKNGEMLDLQSLVAGDNQEADFSYGTGIVTNSQGQQAIIDYTGKVIVDYNTYYNIISTELNYIATKPGGGYILLNLNGSPVNNNTYEGLYTTETQGIYIAKIQNTSQILTATGTVLYETNEEISSYDDMETWESNRNFIAIWVKNNDAFVVDKENFECKCNFQTNNIGVGVDYVTDISNNITYVFDDQAELMFELKDCLIENDSTWDTYRAIYKGVSIRNFLTKFGYLFYNTNNNTTRVVYKDGSVVTDMEYQTGSVSGNVMGLDYIFIENGNNVDVYNKNIKVTTIENRAINYTLGTAYEATSKIIPLSEPVNTYLKVYLYDEKGNMIDNTGYSQKENSDSVFLTEDGKAVTVLSNGEIMDAKDYFSITLLLNKDKDNEYSNQYFIGRVSMPTDNVYETTDTYYFIDRDGNKLLELNSYDTTSSELYEELGLFIYRNAEGTYSVYDLNAKKEILKSESELTLNKEYNLIETTGYYKDVYSISEGTTYQYGV